MSTTHIAATTIPTMQPTELITLLHLASPALPIGGFSYSQGLEAAVDAGFITDGDSARQWIAAGLESVLARCELPFIAQQMQHWKNQAEQTARSAKPASSDAAAHLTESDSAKALAEANQWYLASRESAELRQETEQMGWSLASLCASLEWGDAHSRALLMTLKPVALPTAFAFVTAAHHADVVASLTAYAFNWVENQVAAALKSVPLGQLAGQRILWALREPIATVAQAAATESVEHISTFAPLLAILSSRHETQYSRLFRS